MTQSEIRHVLQEFLLAKYPAARQAGLTPDTPLLDQGIVDSMGILELVAFIEEQFGVTLSDEELLPEHFETIGALGLLVGAHLSTRTS